MIPKIIHYCWFGRGEMPELAQKCIASWRKYLPDYEIKEWNEDNYDVRKIPYIAQAYDAKKYAFVSDYARFDIIYNYGGVYFDTDVEVIKAIDDILAKGAFFGVETVGTINAGLGMASEAGSEIYKEILTSYERSSFIKPDGTKDLTTVVQRVTDIFKGHGFVENHEFQTIAGCNIYPAEYFCPLSSTRVMRKTPNTRCIHHYAGSWVDYTPWQRFKLFVARDIVGPKMTDRIVKLKRRIKKGARN